MVIRIQEKGMFFLFYFGPYVLADDMAQAKLNGDK